MQSARVRILLSAIGLVTLAGCATTEEWETWKGHPSHFASGSHLGFSVRNREGTSTQVSREDIAAAREEGWWGKAITVSQEAILER